MMGKLPNVFRQRGFVPSHILNRVFKNLQWQSYRALDQMHVILEQRQGTFLDHEMSIELLHSTEEERFFVSSATGLAILSQSLMTPL